MWLKWLGSSVGSLFRALILFTRPLSAWPITSQRPYLLIPLYWVSGFSIWILGNTKYSVYSRWIIHIGIFMASFWDRGDSIGIPTLQIKRLRLRPFTSSIPLWPVHFLPQPILEEMPEETEREKKESRGVRKKVCFLLAIATAHFCLCKTCLSTLP